MSPTMLNNTNGKSDWRAWALNISILLIGGLAVLGIGHINLQLQTLNSKIDVIQKENHIQDLCLKELEINQKERMKREGIIR